MESQKKGTVIDMNSAKVNGEIMGVLTALGNTYINRIPSQIMKYLIENCDMQSIPYIDINKRIEEQNISKDARVFLTMLKLKYWCESEEEKENLINLLNDNEKRKK